MPKLTDIEFATMVLMSMDVHERVGVCTASLTSIDEPAQFGALRDAAHKIARHADTLERLERRRVEHGEHCRPEHSGTFPEATASHPQGWGRSLRGFLDRNRKGAVHG